MGRLDYVFQQQLLTIPVTPINFVCQLGTPCISVTISSVAVQAISMVQSKRVDSRPPSNIQCVIANPSSMMITSRKHATSQKYHPYSHMICSLIAPLRVVAIVYKQPNDLAIGLSFVLAVSITSIPKKQDQARQRGCLKSVHLIQ